jgi:hypothetical protein
MNLLTIQILEGFFAVLSIVGFTVDSAPRWGAWLFASLFLGMDTWRCLKIGEISTGPNWKWYGFKFRRDDSPEIFAGIVCFYILLTIALFFIFLCSL